MNMALAWQAEKGRVCGKIRMQYGSIFIRA